MEIVAEGVEGAKPGAYRIVCVSMLRGTSSKPIDQEGMAEVLLDSRGSAYKLPQQSVLRQIGPAMNERVELYLCPQA